MPPWRCPWGVGPGSMPRNAATNARYNGINVLSLNMSAMSSGWSARHWATFHQWRGMGCTVKPRPQHVRPGEWGTRIVFCRPVEKVGKAEDGAEREDRWWVLKEYTVFNAEQVTGAAAERLLSRPNNPAAVIDYHPAEDVMRTCGADIRYGGDRAYYSPEHDYIKLPHRGSFDGEAGFYSTALHEMCHWTGHPSRLNRLGPDTLFDHDKRAFEELVAEIGAAFTCSELGVPQSGDLNNTAAYLSHWLKVLRGDPYAIFRAATQGGRAADLLLSAPGRANEGAEPALAA